MSQQEEARAVAQQQMRRPVPQQQARQARGDGLEAEPPELAGAETSERHHHTSVTLSVPADATWIAATFCPGVTVKYSAASAGRYASVATAVGVPSPMRTRQSVVATSRTL